MYDNSHFIEKGMHQQKPEKGKSLGLRLREDELAALNQLFKIDGLTNLSDLVHSYLNGELSKSANTVQVDSLLKRLKDRNITDPLTGEVTPTFYKNIDEKTLGTI